MRMQLVLAGLMGLVAVVPGAFAKDAHANLDAQAIVAQQQEIRVAAQARRGRYKDMEEAQRSALYARQDTVNQLLEGKKLTTELPERDQIVVFNTLEEIEAILNKAEDERLICERYKPAGSNRPQTKCTTVANVAALNGKLPRSS